VHEVTSPQAFDGLRERGLKVRRPDLTIATADHSIPTSDRSLPIVDPIAAKQLAQLEANCAEFGIRCLGIHSDRQGIVHVIGPELGLTQPGMTVVCGDSHTATHGAFGALGVLAPQIAPRLMGLERADSLAFDFHKWGHVPYDAGFLLVRDGDAHKQAFAMPAAYLQRSERGLALWPVCPGSLQHVRRRAEQ